MSAKAKIIYVCQKCGSQFPKWAGQCADCNTWNSLTEEVVQSKVTSRFGGYAAPADNTLTLLSEVKLEALPRVAINISELDRVLGGGLVPGSVVLVGGDPGIGKSTLLLQALGNLSLDYSVLYVTGEESLQQIAMRASRLELSQHKLHLLAETQVEKIIAAAQKECPQAMVID
jgi:DNA repair protein RadA/Sms